MKDAEVYSQIDDDNKKLYLRCPDTISGFITASRETKKRTKAEALAIFMDDLANTNSLDEICRLFKRVRVEHKGILRFHLDNILHEYGDTDTYKSAILACYGRIIEQGMLTDFTAYNQASIIFIELMRCKLRDSKETKAYKNDAKNKFLKELAEQTTAKAALDYYDMMAADDCVLKLHLENILLKYGRTNTYVDATLHVVKKVGELGNVSQEDMTRVKNLHAELTTISYFLGGKEFKEAILQLDNIIAGKLNVNSQPENDKSQQFTRSPSN